MSEDVEVTIAIRSRGMKRENLDAFVTELRATGLNVTVTASGVKYHANRSGPRLVQRAGVLGVAMRFDAKQHWTLHPWGVKESMGMDARPTGRQRLFNGDDGPREFVEDGDWIVWLTDQEFSCVVRPDVFAAEFDVLQ